MRSAKSRALDDERGCGENGEMYEIPAPMLAKSAAAVPDDANKPMLYEPKWDGFLH